MSNALTQELPPKVPSGQLVEPATEDTATRGISTCIRNGRITQLLWRTAVNLSHQLQASGYCQTPLHPPGRMAHFFATLSARGLDETTADECLGILFKVLPPDGRLGQLFRIPSLLSATSK